MNILRNMFFRLKQINLSRVSCSLISETSRLFGILKLNPKLKYNKFINPKFYYKGDYYKGAANGSPKVNPNLTSPNSKSNAHQLALKSDLKIASNELYSPASN